MRLNGHAPRMPEWSAVVQSFNVWRRRRAQLDTAPRRQLDLPPPLAERTPDPLTRIAPLNPQAKTDPPTQPSPLEKGRGWSRSGGSVESRPSASLNYLLDKSPGICMVCADTSECHAAGRLDRAGAGGRMEARVAGRPREPWASRSRVRGGRGDCEASNMGETRLKHGSDMPQTRVKQA